MIYGVNFAGNVGGVECVLGVMSECNDYVGQIRRGMLCVSRRGRMRGCGC